VAPVKELMAATKATDDRKLIAAYLAAQPPRTRVALRKLREIIKAAAPEGVDAFTYRMPVVKLDGKVLVWYGGFTNHTSLFPVGDAIRKKLAKDLSGYETSKGTVRFPLDKAVPVTLVRKIVKARLDEVRGKA
jgi:uncharacterized protein YdhG (YjbR/CyaY superfamily)